MRTYGEAIDVRTADVPLLEGTRDRGDRDRGDAGSGRRTGTSPVPMHAGAPEQFLWRGRLYLVRDVLAHWVELGTWWSVRGPAGRPVSRSGAAAGAADGGVEGGAGPAGDDAGQPRRRSVAVDVGAVEREVWRVEAAPGRSVTPGVYDLVRDVPAHDPTTGPAPTGPARWSLARALD